MSTIRMHGIEFSYPGSSHSQLANFELVVPSGTCTALVGPSGCAKTTVLRLIAGLERPTRGTITVGDRPMVAPGVFVPAHERAIGMIFQDYALFPHMTVAKNIAYGLTGMGPAAKRARVHELLARVGLGGLERRYPHQLSGGQQQRVALARALAPRPVVLLLDEPFSNLDAELRGSVRSLVKDMLTQSGVTAVLVTHDQEDATALADRVVTMSPAPLPGVGAECYRKLQASPNVG